MAQPAQKEANFWDFEDCVNTTTAVGKPASPKIQRSTSPPKPIQSIATPLRPASPAKTPETVTPFPTPASTRTQSTRLFSNSPSTSMLEHKYTVSQPSIDRSDTKLLEASSSSVFAPSSATTATATELGVFGHFLKNHTCYDMIPHHCKIVVFDTKLVVKKAFIALVQNDIRAAPLWDTSLQQFVGMLTVSDFINILRQYYVSPLVKMDELEEQQIQTWRDLQNCQKKASTTLLSIDPLSSLYSAIDLLISERIHRLPIIDHSSGNVLNIITHKRILLFIYQNFIVRQSPKILECSLKELELGTKRTIYKISPETSVIEALNLFAEHRVSALPIVDENDICIDIYAKADCLNLARERTFNRLDMPVKAALKHRPTFEGVQTCTLNDSFGSIVERIVLANVHRLVLVDEQGHLLGIISLSDILGFLMSH